MPDLLEEERADTQAAASIDWKKLFPTNMSINGSVQSFVQLLIASSAAAKGDTILMAFFASHGTILPAGARIYAAPLGQRPPMAPCGRRRPRCSALNHGHAFLRPLPSKPRPPPSPADSGYPSAPHAFSLPVLLADYDPFERHPGYSRSPRFFNGLHPRALPPALSSRQSARRHVVSQSIRPTSGLALPAAAPEGQRLLGHTWSPH